MVAFTQGLVDDVMHFADFGLEFALEIIKGKKGGRKHDRDVDDCPPDQIQKHLKQYCETNYNMVKIVPD